MTRLAKIYIGSTIAAGLGLLAGCLLRHWQFGDPARYALYIVLAAFGSTLKVRLPKIQGTISLQFLFVLLAVAQLTLCETLILGCLSTLMQSVWRARTRPRLVQVLFNVAALAISTAAAYTGSHALAHQNNLPALLASAACIYYLGNAGLVSLVLSLVSQRPFYEVWRQCYLWTFPYYLIGAGIAGVVSMSGSIAGWKPALLVLPVMYLVHWYYRLYVAQQAPQPSGQTTSAA